MTERRWPDEIHLLHLLAQATGPGSHVRDPSIVVAVAVARTQRSWMK